MCTDNTSAGKATFFSEPIVIPRTSERRYISGKPALNLPAPEGTSGDWHFSVTFLSFSQRRDSDELLIAGEGERINTNKIFGTYGIYECTSALAKRNLFAESGQCYAANHLRAILDLLYDRLMTCGKPIGLERATEDWLDTDEQKEYLLNKALELLPYLDNNQQNELKRWVDDERKPGYRS